MLFCTACLIPGSGQADFVALRPMIGVPEFAEPGDNFCVEMAADPGLSSNAWTVSLVNDLRAWSCTVEQAVYGSYVENDSATGYRLTVRTPSDIAPELFDIVVTHSSGDGSTNRNCVKIVEDLERSFYILHYADPQAETFNAQQANGMSGTHGSIEEMLWAAPVLQLVNPRFVFNTGDELDDGWNNTATRYQEYISAIESFHVPLLITRGNNDTSDLNFWKANIGIPTYSIIMGSFYVCMKDYNANTYRTWLQNNHAASFSDTNITFRLFGQHFTSASAYLPPAGQYPDLMLLGHQHTFTVNQSSPYYRLVSGPAFRYAGVGVFEFLKSGDTWTCPSIEAHGGANKVDLVGNCGVHRITNTFAYANEGSQYANTAFVSNSINYNFRDGRLRFLMRYADGGYKVDGGEKLAEYTYNDGSNVAVVVRVDIAANTVTDVSVSRIDSDADGMPDWWEELHFSGPTNAVASDDDDADECSNLHEFIADTLPWDPDSLLRILDIVPTAGVCRIDWQGGTGAWQYLEYRTDLSNTGEQWIAMFTNPPPTATQTNILTSGGTNDLLLLRIRAERP